MARTRQSSAKKALASMPARERRADAIRRRKGKEPHRTKANALAAEALASRAERPPLAFMPLPFKGDCSNAANRAAGEGKDRNSEVADEPYYYGEEYEEYTAVESKRKKSGEDSPWSKRLRLESFRAEKRMETRRLSFEFKMRQIEAQNKAKTEMAAVQRALAEARAEEAKARREQLALERLEKEQAREAARLARLEREERATKLKHEAVKETWTYRLQLQEAERAWKAQQNAVKTEEFRERLQAQVHAAEETQLAKARGAASGRKQRMSMAAEGPGLLAAFQAKLREQAKPSTPKEASPTPDKESESPKKQALAKRVELLVSMKSILTDEEFQAKKAEILKEVCMFAMFTVPIITIR
eukprot:scaffold963_cov206-Pinguiococcus_pyrenoidosus.AAC.2